MQAYFLNELQIGLQMSDFRLLSFFVFLSSELWKLLNTKHEQFVWNDNKICILLF